MAAHPSNRETRLLSKLRSCQQELIRRSHERLAAKWQAAFLGFVVRGVCFRTRAAQVTQKPCGPNLTDPVAQGSTRWRNDLCVLSQ
jgi:hypothetical protein